MAALRALVLSLPIAFLVVESPAAQDTFGARAPSGAAASFEARVGSALETREPDERIPPGPDAPESPSERSFGPMPLRALGGMGTIFYQPLAERASTLKEGEMRLGAHLYYAAINDDGFNDVASADLDGEILRWDTRFDYGVLDNLELSIIIPLHYTTGGFLDSTIDKFHEITGLPRTRTEGNNGFKQEITVDGEMVFGLDNHEFSLGDIPVQLKWSLLTEEESPLSLAMRTGVELPTGDTDKSLGSGGVDLGVGFVLEKNFDTTSLFLSADYVYLQRAGPFKDAGVDFEDYVVTAAFAAEWRPWDWMGMTAQLDFLTNVLARTGVPELDEPQVLGSLGLSFAITQSAHFRLGFTEDMTSAASADFAAYGALTWRF